MAIKNFVITFILGVLLVFNIFTFNLVNATETRTVSNFVSDDSNKQSDLLSEFENLDGASRNQVLENSKDIGKQKNTLVEKITRRISEKNFYEALKNENLKKNINLFLPETLNEINKLNLFNVKDVDTLKSIFLKAGIDLNPKDLNKLSMGSLNGFDSSDLKWTKQKTKDGKSLNVIGNPEAGVWLNLGDIPMATKRMEYDSSNKQFILTMKDGGKVVVGKGVVNSDGEFKAFSKVDMNGIGKSFSKNPNFKMDFKNLEVKKGEVVFSEDKIELKGETQATFGEFTFNRKKDESSGISTIKFDGNKIMLTGTEMRYGDYEKIGSTTTPFLYIQGDYKKEAVKVTSLEDAVPGTVYGYNWKKIYQKYDESGKLIGLSEDGTSWIGLDDTAGLNKLSKNYGDFTKKLVSHIVKKEGDVTYSIVDEAFYTSGKLKEDGRQLITEQLYENFYARDGNLLDIGGKGDVELLKSADILKVHDAKGFDFKVGENAFLFNEKGVSSPTTILKGELEIPFIDQLSNNQVIKKYSLTKDENSNLVFNDDRKTVYIGGKAFSVKKIITPEGSSSSLKLEMSPSVGIAMNSEDFNSVKSATEASSDQRETMIQESLQKSSLTLKTNLGLDVEGIKIDSKNIGQYVKDNNLGITLGNLLAAGKSTTTDVSLNIEGKLYSLKPEVVETLSNALIKSAQGESGEGMGVIDLSKLSVEITNTKSGSMLTLVSGNVRGKSMPITTTITTSAGTFNEDIGKTALEAVLRAPDTNLGIAPISVAKGWAIRDSQYGFLLTKYSFESQMGSGRFGLTSQKWAKMMYLPDEIFFKGVDKGLGIGKPVYTGKGLFDKWFNPIVKPIVKTK